MCMTENDTRVQVETRRIMAPNGCQEPWEEDGPEGAEYVRGVIVAADGESAEVLANPRSGRVYCSASLEGLPAAAIAEAMARIDDATGP